MSASNKKQQRKAAMAEGLTQRQLKEQAEAAAAKRKKTAYTVVGVVCAVAAVALLVWNNFGSWTERSHQNAVAATVGGVDYTVAALAYYYAGAMNTEASMYQYYSQLGISSPYNPYADAGAQWQDEANGVTYADYFRQEALDSLQQTAAICAAAKAEGYTLSEAGQQQITDQLAQIDVVCAQNGLTRGAYFSQVYGISEKVFVRNYTNDVLADEYATYHNDSITYTDADLQAYYKEDPDNLDSYDYRSFFISGDAADPTDENGEPLVDADGNTITASDEEKTAAMEAAKAATDEAVAAIEASEDREAAFIAAAPQYVSETVRDAYSSPEYSLSEGVLGNNLTRSSSAIATWLMDSGRKSGDVTAIESTNSTSGNGYFVVMFLDRYLDEDNSVNIRHILIKAETTEEDQLDDNQQPIPSQEALDAAKEKAQALMDEWQAGDKTAESFGILANANSDDPGSNTRGGRYAYVNEGDMFAGFNDWIFDPARKSGDVGLVENPQSGQQGWHVVYFEGTDGSWKDVAETAKANADQSAWLTSVTEGVEAVATDGMQYVGSANTAVPTTPEPSESVEPTESPEA